MDNDLIFEPIPVPEPDLALIRFRQAQELDLVRSLSIPAALIQEVEDVT